MRIGFTSGVLACLALVAAGAAAQSTITGPTSSQSPYAVPTAAGWITASIISTGDRPADGRYMMAGIPDGLGAMSGRIENGQVVADPAFMTVFMNHEILAGSGVTRLHGQNGSFVSQWTIQLNTLLVTRGEDLIRDLTTTAPSTAASCSRT